MFCPHCGTPNQDGAKFCEKCGVAMAATPPPPDANVNPGPPPPQPYNDPRMRGGSVTPQVLPPGEKIYVTGKNPAVALVLSLVIPGVGQFYNGDNKKGAIMLAILVVSAMLSALGIGLIGVLGVWLWSMFDAYNVASGKAPIMS